MRAWPVVSLIVGLPVLVLAQTRPADQGSAASPIQVGANVHVSAGRAPHPHYELLSGAHPTDPNKLLACGMVTVPETNKTNSIVYASMDGGRTWKQTFEAAHNELTGDPVCEYGLGDNAYFIVLVTSRPATMRVYRSADAGLTWSDPVVLPFIDREWFAVDRTGGKFNGRIYINGTGSVRAIDDTRESAVALFRSTDGATFLGPTYRTSVGAQHVFGMGNSVVLSDGTLVTLFGHMKDSESPAGRQNRPGYANAWLRVVTSDDGGLTMSSGTVVSEWYQGPSVGRGLAIDSHTEAFKDRLYAVWTDSRSGRAEILLSYSADKAKTWSTPTSVVDDRTDADPDDGPEVLLPTVAVNKDGVVGVAWYDRREHADNLGWDLRFSASLDGGETFLPSVKVASQSNKFGAKEIWPVRGNVSGGGTPRDPSAPPSREPLRVALGVDSFFHTAGHTSGFMAGADGRFHPVWVDNRTGVSQVWTAPVTVTGRALKYGSTELADFEDVSKHVTLDLSTVSFDRAKGVATFAMQVKNTSKETIVGPLKLRVIRLRSDVGVPAIVGADAGGAGVGAVFDLSAKLPGGRLEPDKSSEARTITVQLSDLRPLREKGRTRYGLLDLQVSVLAKVEKKATSTAEAR